MEGEEKEGSREEGEEGRVKKGKESRKIRGMKGRREGRDRGDGRGEGRREGRLIEGGKEIVFIWRDRFRHIWAGSWAWP